MIITYKSSFNWHLILGSERNSLIFMIGQAALPYMVQILAPEWAILAKGTTSYSEYDRF